MNSWKTILIIIAVIFAIIISSVFICFSVQNKAIAFEEQITTAVSEIQIQEKRRGDLIPNLVDCVKEYDKHEYQVMVDLIKERGSNTDEIVDTVQTMINAVAEAYPDLKSSENYKDLMNELSITENLIAGTRTNYNKWVTKYNSFIRQFPNSGILNIVGYEKQDFEKLDFDMKDDAPTNIFD